MKQVINPGNARKSLTVIDNIVYSVQENMKGEKQELKMSIMLQNGNSEMKLAAGKDDPGEDHSPKPALVWIPGGGWRGTDKNLMLGEMKEFADSGYVVASIYYRSSSEGHFPDQIEDVKTAIRFLRAHAEQYEIDPERIGIMGRSAGGYLAGLAAMNTDVYEGEEWSEYSSRVQACCDMFGPVDLLSLMEAEEERMKVDPGFRWKTIEETHGGALLGGDIKTIKERAKAASPVHMVTDAMCPVLILHGDNDPIVPCSLSSDIFYEKIKEAGLESKADYYIIKNAGHGSREFFQPEMKDLMIQFFNEHLK